MKLEQICSSEIENHAIEHRRWNYAMALDAWRYDRAKNVAEKKHDRILRNGCDYAVYLLFLFVTDEVIQFFNNSILENK